jgi:hypothetical protein
MLEVTLSLIDLGVTIYLVYYYIINERQKGNL